MIKTKMGATDLKGSSAELYADFAVITRALVEAFTEAGADKDKVIENLKISFDDGLKDDAELVGGKEKLDKIEKVLGELIKLLSNDDDDEEKESD